MKNEYEMKKVNEEILKTWRDLGFLNGLTEGSQMEWRCAKSFDLMAKYLMEKELGSSIVALYAFPILRRVICSNRPRLNKIIQPNELLDLFEGASMMDIINYVSGKKQKTSSQLSYIINYIKYSGMEDSSLLYIIDNLNKDDNELLKNVLSIDIIAELAAIFSQYVNYKLDKK